MSDSYCPYCGEKTKTGFVNHPWCMKHPDGHMLAKFYSHITGMPFEPCAECFKHHKLDGDYLCVKCRATLERHATAL